MKTDTKNHIGNGRKTASKCCKPGSGSVDLLKTIRRNSTFSAKELQTAGISCCDPLSHRTRRVHGPRAIRNWENCEKKTARLTETVDRIARNPQRLASEISIQGSAGGLIPEDPVTDPVEQY